ncbi:hypothetical protein KY348_03150 [Candidatus Woesearchaeota archaeon]|nr:hypothetical protein [Candidatus Woesearchaeota archaeon]
MNRREFLELIGKGALTLSIAAAGIPLVSCSKKESLESKLDKQETLGVIVETYANELFSSLQIPDEFNRLYKKITGEEKPDNVKLAVLPLKDYIENYKLLNQKNPDLLELIKKEYTGNIEFTIGHPKEYLIVVLDNTKDFLLESVSHGIGHARYGIEYYKSRPQGDINIETDKAVRETAAHIAVQKALCRKDPKKYIKTRYYDKVFIYFDNKECPQVEYAIKLIEKHGVDTAWDKILSIRKEEELEGIIL